MAAVMILLGVGSFWLWSQTRHLNAELELAQARQRAYEQSDQNAKQQTNKLQRENEELAQQLKQEQAAREQLVKEQEQLKTQAQNPSTQPALIIPFTLEPGISRSETDTPKPILVPRLASRIQLTLALGSDDGKGKYSAELSSRGGTSIWSHRGLSA